MTRSEETYRWYDLDGSLTTRERAKELMRNWDERKVDSTRMTFYGDVAMVVTSFVPVDLGEGEGDPENPLLWISEVVGGPPDLDGRQERYLNRDDAVAGHKRMVEQALSSGCSLYND